MIPVYISLLLLLACMYLLERRLRFQSERLDIQAERRGELERLFRREIESLSGSLHRIDQQLQKDTNQFGVAVAAGFRGCDANFIIHEDRLDTNTKRLNDAWSHLLRLEGRLEGYAVPLFPAADGFELTGRVKSLELAVDQILATKGRTRV